MKKRLLALLTVLCMLLSMLPATAFAKTVEPLEPVYISQYNPLYGEPDEGITLEQYAPVTLADHAFEGQNYPDDREQVVATLRAGLEARQDTITFNYFLDGDTYDGSKEAGEAMLGGLFASALEHTGQPTEGDYIHWVYEQMSADSNGYIYGGDYYLTITFHMTYYTTAAQEQAVTNRLATVMPSFGFTAETDDYTKVKTIYDYICDNVVYDNANLEDDSYKLKYTAYAALINGTSVCQGYAVLLYRMLLMAGVDNRVITGISNGGNHAWNIIKLGEYYYDADSTWDAGETEYDYFLRCPANFDPTHVRHDEYDTAAFNTAYPMASADYDPLSNTEFAGGTGVEGNPYLISTKTHLNNVRNYLGAHFKMTNDIVFTDADFAEGGAFYNGGAGWTPIGDDYDNAFTGVFDGNGFAIKNLYINLSINNSDVYAGLFGYCRGTIKNLGMEDGEITATSQYPHVGSIVGSANSPATITNCYNTCNVSTVSTKGHAYIGGIAGRANSTTITNCYNTGDVSAAAATGFAYAYTGGIVGYTSGDTTIANCYNIGSVSAVAADITPSLNTSANAHAGGVVGSASGVDTTITITNCYNAGNVSAAATNGSAHAGGIVGNAHGITISGICYNTGKISSSESDHAYAGGITGLAIDTAITTCYNVGSVSATTSSSTSAGGIVGSSNGTAISDCYSIGSVFAASTDGNSTSGGIAGSATTITNCYNIGSVSATSTDGSAHAGGVMGYLSSSTTVSTCYNAGSVSADGSSSYAGSIAGYIWYSWNGTLSNCYYLDNSAQGVGAGTDTATKRTDAQMRQDSYFADFNFTTVWTMSGNANYPYPELQALNHINCTTHKLVNHTGYAATCFTDGLTDGVQCSVCLAWLTPQTPIEAGHDYENGYCTVCGLPEGLTYTVYHTVSGDTVTVTGYTGSLTELTVPETINGKTVTAIGDSAFNNCSSLTGITIPNKVTDIGDRAFYNCAALTKITLNGDLPIFGTACFDAATATALYPCDNDTWTDTLVANLASAYPSVTWTAAHDPKTVSGTPNSCFSGGISDGVQCTICEEWLTPQTPVPAGHKLIVDGYCTVCGLPQGLTYTVNGDTVTVTDYTGSLTELTIPETINGKTVTAIDDYAFDGCVRLTRITLPDSVTDIGKFAFMSCSALENVNIPASVNAIRNGTFSGCASLKTVSLPTHIGSIGDYAFDGCTGLERITLPNSVTSIGMYAFESCTALKSITIPKDVIDIGKHAFVYCSHLAEVRFLGNAPIFGPNCFSGVTADAYYPCGDTWTENKLQSYGGSISWTVEHNYVGGVCTGCGAAEPTVDGVYRLAGSNRFDTAFKSADALKEVMGVDKFPAAIVTSGMNFADALAGSYLAARTGAPILLTDNDNMADVIAYILENVEVGGTVYALGGSSIVSDTLRAVTNSGYTFKRLAGASRFETNLLILEEAGIDSGDSVLVCTAYNFADSLSASALGLPILLVDDTVSAAQMAFLEENADGEFILVGGTGAVKPAVEQQLREKWDVVRLAGASRFDTSVLTAIESFGSSGVDYAVLAYGYNFPDGLCAGPLAYALGAPLILTANGDESAAVEYATAAGITDGFVLGGPSLIDDTVTRAIFSMTAGDIIQR